MSTETELVNWLQEHVVSTDNHDPSSAVVLRCRLTYAELWRCQLADQLKLPPPLRDEALPQSEADLALWIQKHKDYADEKPTVTHFWQGDPDGSDFWLQNARAILSSPLVGAVEYTPEHQSSVVFEVQSDQDSLSH